VVEELCLEIQKYALKEGNVAVQDQLNLVGMLQVRTLNCFINKSKDEMFYLLKSASKLRLLVEMEGSKLKVKCSEPRMTLGFTSNISFISSEMEAAEQLYSKSFFHTLSEPSAVEKVEGPEQSLELYLLIPECTLTLSLQLKGFKMLSNQAMRMPELYFHNRLSSYL